MVQYHLKIMTFIHSFFAFQPLRLLAFVVNQVCLSVCGPGDDNDGDGYTAEHALRTPCSALLDV